MEKITEDLKREVFEFLYVLRQQAVVNMFGARPAIKIAYPELSLKQCGDLLNDWMHNFDKSRL